jgi:hypothetical protein
MVTMEDGSMSQAHWIPADRPFIAAAEIWHATQTLDTVRPVADESTVPLSTERLGSLVQSSIGQFIAERLWKVLEATVIQPPTDSEPGSSAILSIPWYSDERRDLALLLRSYSSGGTLEVWHVDPDRDELRLSSGYFGKWDEFRRITASTRFAKGSGLPGRVWITEQPVLFEDLGESKAFLRAEAAQSIGLRFGIGLPVHYASGLGVVVLLSSLSTPIARAVDIWRLCNPGELEHLQGMSLSMTAKERACALATAQELALRAATEFSPQVLPDLSNRAHSLPPQPFEFGCAWPSRDRSGVVHIATLVG